MTPSVRHLAELFQPADYKLELDISQRVKRVFSGAVTVTGTLVAVSDSISLHSKDLRITKASIDGQPVTTTEGKDDELQFKASHELAAGAHALDIEFTGTITDPMHGIYPCYFTHNGTNKELLMTQLESHSAREVFPCIDEPAAKATFALILTTEPDITVLSNTPATTQKDNGSVLVTAFETTPKMSTYLLAFVAGELESLETKSQHGVTIRTYATPGKGEFTRFALDLAAKVLDFDNDYFGIPYPLPKLDLVAVPDFAAGAMENWGLTTYRESMMLVEPEHASADTKQIVAITVAHELAHQWFGDLVTMAWWDDVWLNESFANWMEHYTVDHFFPEWQDWEMASAGEQQYAFNRDGLGGVQAVKQPVHHPDEIHSLFDAAIVYAKGSCLIRMLNQYMGADAFRDGLRLYMQRHKYGNATSGDLWAALQNTSHKPIARFMNHWVTQPGHPVVTVGAGSSTVTLHQRRFYSNPKQATASDPTVWTVPLLSAQLTQAELAEPTATLQKLPGELLLNDGYAGFYHTQYDSQHLGRLARLVENNKLPTVARLALLADNLALVRAGLASTTDLLGLLQHYEHETSYPVWQIIISVIGAVRLLVNNDQELKPYVQRYVRHVATEEFTRLGWQPKEDEPYFDQLLRPSITSLMAYAEAPEVVQHALALYDSAKQPADLLPDLRPVIYSVAVRERGRPAYERLLGWYEHTTSAEERINLIVGLTSMDDEQLAREVTTHFNGKLIRLQDMFYWFIYLMRNPHGTQAAWQWMKDNWNWIEKQFKGDMDFAYYPKYSASAMSTREQLADYKAFFEPKLSEASLATTIKQGIEDIEVRVLWRERDLQDVAALLKRLSAS
jgi:aminopeptidase N